MKFIVKIKSIDKNDNSMYEEMKKGIESKSLLWKRLPMTFSKYFRKKSKLSEEIGHFITCKDISLSSCNDNDNEMILECTIPYFDNKGIRLKLNAKTKYGYYLKKNNSNYNSLCNSLKWALVYTYKNSETKFFFESKEKLGSLIDVSIDEQDLLQIDMFDKKNGDRTIASKEIDDEMKQAKREMLVSKVDSKISNEKSKLDKGLEQIGYKIVAKTWFASTVTYNDAMIEIFFGYYKNGWRCTIKEKGKVICKDKPFDTNKLLKMARIWIDGKMIHPVSIQAEVTDMAANKTMGIFLYKGKVVKASCKKEAIVKSSFSPDDLTGDDSDMSVEDMWDFLLEYNIATEEELQLVTDIDGYNKKSLTDILYVREGYKEFNDYYKSEIE